MHPFLTGLRAPVRLSPLVSSSQAEPENRAPVHLSPLAGSSQAELENRAPCPLSVHSRASEVDKLPLS